MRLLISAILKFIIGMLLVGMFIFIPAGSFNYFGGILFIAILFIPIFLMGIILFIKAPELLERRLDGKETEKTQKGVVGFSALVFISGFIVAGLDFRFSWSYVPKSVAIIAAVLFLIAYGIYAEVMRENAYLARTVTVQENQKVIDTGLYGVVRHPMYAATVLLFMMIPIVLGSWWSLICFAFYPIIIVIRILNEEKVLSEQLEGYIEYKRKVKYRLLPFIW
ncbi:MAG: isoprenylcysteine carboxylmethyltransferase family protein [Clostridia bacterium]|nr:isoprenylcysteine carboxylmethyltransferase family protein [Clostridia bacterium]